MISPIPGASTSIAATVPRLWTTRFADDLRAGDDFVTAIALIQQLLAGRGRGNTAVGVRVLARGARTDPVHAERLLESLERMRYVRRLSATRRRGESSEWILTCEPARTTLRAAFERFALDPRNSLLSLNREGVGNALLNWIDRDEWINAPLEQSLPAAGTP